MEQAPLNVVLSKADDSLLKEILREAESRLEVQLTTALASDMRAMTFLGFIAASIVVCAAGTLSLMTSSTPDMVLGAIGWFATMGLIGSSYYAFQATRPIDFGVVGNDPSSWIGDVTNRTSLHEALAEQCAHYDDCLKSNRVAMAKSAEHLLWSSHLAICTVALSFFFASFIWLQRVF